MATENVTPAEFLALLESHDWFYGYSDCGRTWREGEAMQRRINALAAADETLAELLAAYRAFLNGEGDKPTAETATPAGGALRAPESDEEETLTQCGTQGRDGREAAAESVTEVPSRSFTRSNLAKLLGDGKVARVEFIKRSTGEPRTMRCRLGVTRHLSGGGAAYSAQAKNLLTVFDMDAGGYRSIPVEGVRRVQTCGQMFSV